MIKFALFLLLSLTTTISFANPSEKREIENLRFKVGDSSEIYSLNFSTPEASVESMKWLAFALRDRENNEFTDINTSLVVTLIAIQNKLDGALIIINSGYRSFLKNKSILGASDKSHHLIGNGVDFTMEGIPLRTVGKTARQVLDSLWGKSVGGVGVYKTHVHMDMGRGRKVI